MLRAIVFFITEVLIIPAAVVIGECCSVFGWDEVPARWLDCGE